jgi:hypothetical protein
VWLPDAATDSARELALATDYFNCLLYGRHGRTVLLGLSCVNYHSSLPCYNHGHRLRL